MSTDEQVSEGTGPPPQGRVMELITSLWMTHVTAAIARLGVPDHLAGGPRTAAELAGAVSADAAAMARLLRAGAGLGLVEEVPPGRYALTALGECLVTGAGTLRDYAVMMTDPFQARPLEHFAQAIASGRPAAHAALGCDIWAYLRGHPDQASHFAGAMTGLSAARAPVVAACFDPSPYQRIVDVGGGHGVLLRALLARAPQASGVLFDLPEVVAGAADAVAGCPGPPIETAGGSFFDGVPAGADLYVLAHVLCDWDDGPAAKILANCHRAGQPGHTLAVVEALLPQRPGDALIPFLLDLHLLVTNGGKIRPAGEFRALLAGAGYELERIINLPGGQNIVLARA
jgi:O-methyltransferase domain/Dimerisation domain